MSSSSSPAGAVAPARSVFVTLFPITLAVFVGFLTIGLSMPVLPLHVQGTLGMSSLVVGVVIGAQFAAAVLLRAWAGSVADVSGAKRVVVGGFIVAACSGATYFVSTIFTVSTSAVAMLIVGRVLLGCAESFVVTGALTWGIGLVGPQHAGKVMAWVGIAMYGAYATGAPIGVAVYGQTGFTGVALLALLIPLIAATIVVPARPIAPSATRRVPFYKVLRVVWLPGLGLSLSSVGFGAITGFIALLFAARHWGNASLVFTSFGAAFIGARLLFGHLPDRLGGARVALICVGIEAVGQFAIWQADTAAVALVGAALTGFGYSLAFPAFGVEAVKRSPPQSRGMAMGAYVAFLDISLGFAGPAMGMVGTASLDSVYLLSTGVVACAAIVAGVLLARRPQATQRQAEARNV